MKPGSEKILARALFAAQRAQVLLGQGAIDRAVERAYYAIIHAARVVLNEAGDRARSHDAVRDKLARLTPPAPQSLCQAVARAIRSRDHGEALLYEDAEQLVTLACDVVGGVSSRIDRVVIDEVGKGDTCSS